MSLRPSSTGLLTELAELVIEAALDAELDEHLARPHNRLVQRGRRNSRNGSRSKTVRTLVGPVRVEVPRDRWGTFQPTTVGKWQREVVGIDRVILPLAAKNAPARESMALIAQAYPPDTPSRTLGRIVESVRARLSGWHDRAVERPYPILHVHASSPRAQHSQVIGFPVLSVVGYTPPDDQGHQRRELLSLHALEREGMVDPWVHVVGELRRRGLSGVRSVAGSAAAPFRDAAAGVWPMQDREVVTA